MQVFEAIPNNICISKPGSSPSLDLLDHDPPCTISQNTEMPRGICMNYLKVKLHFTLHLVNIILTAVLFLVHVPASSSIVNLLHLKNSQFPNQKLYISQFIQFILSHNPIVARSHISPSPSPIQPDSIADIAPRTQSLIQPAGPTSSFEVSHTLRCLY